MYCTLGTVLYIPTINTVGITPNLQTTQAQLVIWSQNKNIHAFSTEKTKKTTECKII